MLRYTSDYFESFTETKFDHPEYPEDPESPDNPEGPDDPEGPETWWPIKEEKQEADDRALVFVLTFQKFQIVNFCVPITITFITISCLLRACLFMQLPCTFLC